MEHANTAPRLIAKSAMHRLESEPLNPTNFRIEMRKFESCTRAESLGEFKF
jgi:hypothetical protein